MKVSSSSLAFTAAELAEIERRMRESAKMIAKLAAADTLEQQEQLADELCPRHDRWIAGRNRIQSTRARRPVPALIVRPRPRARRPQTRRTGSSSRTSGTDPGDPDPEPPPPRTTARWRKVEVAYAEREGERIDGELDDAIALDDLHEGVER